MFSFSIRSQCYYCRVRIVCFWLLQSLAAKSTLCATQPTVLARFVLEERRVSCALFVGIHKEGNRNLPANSDRGVGHINSKEQSLTSLPALTKITTDNPSSFVLALISMEKTASHKTLTEAFS